jgi:hypothetical protein
MTSYCSPRDQTVVWVLGKAPGEASRCERAGDVSKINMKPLKSRRPIARERHRAAKDPLLLTIVPLATPPLSTSCDARQ